MAENQDNTTSAAQKAAKEAARRAAIKNNIETKSAPTNEAVRRAAINQNITRQAQERQNAARQVELARRAALQKQELEKARKAQEQQAATQPVNNTNIKLPQPVLHDLEQPSFGDLVMLPEETKQPQPSKPVSNRPTLGQNKPKQQEPEQVSNRKKTVQEPIPKQDDYDSSDIPQEGTWLVAFGSIGQWFQTLCWMNIPFIGFLYMFILALRKSTSKEKKQFAIAFMLYKLLVWLLAFTVLFIFYKMGLSFMEQILAYIDAHS